MGIEGPGNAETIGWAARNGLIPQDPHLPGTVATAPAPSPKSEAFDPAGSGPIVYAFVHLSGLASRGLNYLASRFKGTDSVEVARLEARPNAPVQSLADAPSKIWYGIGNFFGRLRDLFMGAITSEQSAIANSGASAADQDKDTIVEGRVRAKVQRVATGYVKVSTGHTAAAQAKIGGKQR